MEKETIERILELLTFSTGIIPRDSHKTGIINFLEKRFTELGIKEKDYYNLLISDSEEMDLLINSATVNETYFFREEKQFQLLKEKIFPSIKLKTDEKKLDKESFRIWSAASSSGEEIYSLYLLAVSMGFKTECTASDINTQMLERGRIGKFTKHSARNVDGSLFHYLLEPSKKEDGSFEFEKSIIEKICFKRINLSRLKDFPQNQNLIFLRNVFIYFDLKTRKKILKKIVEESLAPGGYLFVSMNEIASIDNSIIPKNLEKKFDGKVFYFQKTEGGNA